MGAQEEITSTSTPTAQDEEQQQFAADEISFTKVATALTLGCIGFVIYATILGAPLLGLEVGFGFTLGQERDIIISPFPQVVEQYQPDSTLCCYFPALVSPEYDSFRCSNLTGTNRAYYCPKDFICQDETVGSPVACLSELQACGSFSQCALGISGLEYVADSNRTAKVLPILNNYFIYWWAVIQVIILVGGAVVSGGFLLTNKARR